MTRVLHYGDSPTTADLITADVRGMLQKEFGDGGTGFVLIARPWAWYNHRGVEMSAPTGRSTSAGNSPLKDGLHGLGAVSFRGATGAVAHWTLKDRRTSSVEVSYLAEPDGRRFHAGSDGQALGTVHSAADQKRPGVRITSIFRRAPRTLRCA